MAARHDSAPAACGDHDAPCLLVPSEAAGLALQRMAAQRGLVWRSVAQARAAELPDRLRAARGVVAVCLDALADGVPLLDAIANASRAGARIVVLHAGVEAAPDGVLPAEGLRAALLEAHGAIGADSHRDLLDIAFLLADMPRLPAGGRVAILTGGGGGGVIAADLCTRAGLQVPPLSAQTRALLQPLLPAIASTGNPVDLTPEMFTEKLYDGFATALDVVAADPEVDAVLLPTTFNAPRGNAVAAQVLAAFARRCPKPVVVAANPPREMLDIFAAGSTPVVPDVAHAARALAKLLRRAAWRPPAPAPALQAAAPLTWAALQEAGFAVEAGAAPAGQLTLRIIATRDGAFGPVVALGAGGIHGRILDAVDIHRAPFDATAAAALLASNRVVAHARKMLGGLDLAPSAAALARLSGLVAAEPAPRFTLVLDPVEIMPGGLRVREVALTRSGP